MSSDCSSVLRAHNDKPAGGAVLAQQRLNASVQPLAVVGCKSAVMQRRPDRRAKTVDAVQWARRPSSNACCV